MFLAKNRVKLFIIGLFSILFLSSCTYVHITYADVNNKELRLMQKKDVISFAWKAFHISEGDLLIYDSVALDTIYKRPYKPSFLLDYHPLLQFKVFNNRGRLVSQYAYIEGPLNKKILGTVPPGNIFPVDEAYYLRDDLKYYHTFDGNMLTERMFKEAFVMIVYWTLIASKESINFVGILDKYIQSNKEKNIRLILVNMDVILSD